MSFGEASVIFTEPKSLIRSYMLSAAMYPTPDRQWAQSPAA